MDVLQSCEETETVSHTDLVNFLWRFDPKLLYQALGNGYWLDCSNVKAEGDQSNHRLLTFQRDHMKVPDPHWGKTPHLDFRQGFRITHPAHWIEQARMGEFITVKVAVTGPGAIVYLSALAYNTDIHFSISEPLKVIILVDCVLVLVILERVTTSELLDAAFEGCIYAACPNSSVSPSKKNVICSDLKDCLAASQGRTFLMVPIIDSRQDAQQDPALAFPGKLDFQGIFRDFSQMHRQPGITAGENCLVNFNMTPMLCNFVRQLLKLPKYKDTITSCFDQRKKYYQEVRNRRQTARKDRQRAWRRAQRRRNRRIRCCVS